MTTRDESVRTLAEAMGPPNDITRARTILQSPKLSADLDLGTAWRLAVAALPEGRGLSLALDGPGYVASATRWDLDAIEAWSGCDHMERCDCPAPTPIAALDALRAALEARPR